MLSSLSPSGKGWPRSSRMISKAAVAAVVLAGYSLAQQVPLQIIPPPATPTDINASGPPVPAPNDTAYPVPGPPAQAIGTINLNFTVGTPDLPVYPSIPLKGNFLGLSIELSVVDEILGKTPEKINVPFLNYMAAVAARAGMGPMIRIGGNTQDTAIYNDTSTTATAMIVKVSDHGFNPENGAPITPSIEYNDLVFQVMQGLAEKINSHYIWGLNMVNYTASFTEPMVKTLNSYVADQVELILVGNEPDRYTLTGNRDMSYDIPTYLNEWEDLTGRVMGDFGNAKVFTAPNVCCQWTTFQVTETNGMRERFSDRMGAISAIKYPQSLCGMTPIGHEYYLNHTNTIDFAYYDADAITAAVNGGLPYYLVETNTASCIGLNGVSNAFTSALWGIDAALQMAFKNHTGVFFHTSGINTIYNVFTTPAYNASTKSWKTGPIFYSYLVVSEALASTTNSSRVVDIGTGRDDAAAYAIYEEETVKKVVLVNMITGGENTWTANVPAPSDGAIVSYKLLTAPGVDAVQNITWANQTFGYWSDGILQGTEQVQTATCANGVCPINVPAPGAALVFLTPDVTIKAQVPTFTFEPYGTDNPSIVINSNGSRGQRAGSTSKGSSSGTLPSIHLPSNLKAALAASIAFGALLAGFLP